jgi:biotin carboxyl carrier protein
VAAVEAMKAEHEVRTPVAGRVSRIAARLGDEVDGSQPILVIEG